MALKIARRMGGAKRYPSIAICEGDGFREGLNPSYARRPSLRAKRSNPSFRKRMDCFVASLLAMAIIRDLTEALNHGYILLQTRKRHDCRQAPQASPPNERRSI